MVRVNLIDVKKLSDQHLIAEHVEILMLVGGIKDDKKEGERKDRPESYRLGKGHINFFKDKLLYLKKRHIEIKKEMKARGFKTDKNLKIERFNKKLKKDFFPSDKDEEVIKNRLREKLEQKDGWYRYRGVVRKKEFFFNLMN